MPVRPLAGRLFAATCVALSLAACADVPVPSNPIAAAGISRSGGGGLNGNGGRTNTSGTLGGPNTAPLPVTPPAPDIIFRESFGINDGARLAGGKGVVQQVISGTVLNGLWAEYPGSKNTQWVSAEGEATFTLGGGCGWENPGELPSTYQSQGYDECAWFVPFTVGTIPVTQFPTALMPIASLLPAAGYEFSMDAWPWPAPNSYVAIGFTNSGVLANNLSGAGTLWVRLTDPTGSGQPLHYELRTGSLAAGQLLASGDAGTTGPNHMALRVAPAAGTVTFTFGSTVVGTFPVAMSTPRYIAFEGLGNFDNAVVRR